MLRLQSYNAVKNSGQHKSFSFKSNQIKLNHTDIVIESNQIKVIQRNKFKSHQIIMERKKSIQIKSFVLKIYSNQIILFLSLFDSTTTDHYSVISVHHLLLFCYM